MLAQLEARVIRITVTELRDSTFYASITIQQNGSEIEIDSRPSDAIALAVRAEAPIFADDRVIEESAIEFEGEEVNEEEIVDEFRRFLDHVTPDEFAVEEDGEEEASRPRHARPSAKALTFGSEPSDRPKAGLHRSPRREGPCRRSSATRPPQPRASSDRARS